MRDISKEELEKEIPKILENANLANTTMKKVRQKLEDSFDCDLMDKRILIDQLVMKYLNSKDNDGPAKEEILLTHTAATAESVKAPVLEQAASLTPAAQEVEIPVREASPPQPAWPGQEPEASQRVTLNRQTRKRKTCWTCKRPAREPAAVIAAVEIKCRQELHQIQMENEERRKENEERIKENEERRKRNLELKERLLLTKLDYFKRENNLD
ncbi:uncharacterized protein LOC134801209 [Cydia splendana]|uniref:uncharacterized protein LOC134801209 n=1 Tax=Cydia splendana TaxID=1100963 RepID=UPI0028F4AC73